MAIFAARAIQGLLEIAYDPQSEASALLPGRTGALRRCSSAECLSVGLAQPHGSSKGIPESVCGP